MTTPATSWRARVATAEQTPSSGRDARGTPGLYSRRELPSPPARSVEVPPVTHAPTVPTSELVERCLDGDESAWNALVDRYQGLVYSVALQVGLDEDDAGDVFQYVWLELHRSLLRLRDGGSLPKWLMVATRRQAYKVAARRRRALVPLEGEGGPQLLDPSSLPDETIVAAENRRRLEAALDRLDPAAATLIRLLFLDPSHPSYEEIARRTGLAVGSIGPMRARHLKKLKQLMEETS